MDRTTITRLRGICELLEELKPLLQENISRLQQEGRRQEPLIQRLLEPEIATQEALIPRIQESIEHLQATILPSKPIPPQNLDVPLIVAMPNGEMIAETRGMDTFVNVIEKLGIEWVRSLGIVAVQSRNLPLISDYEDPQQSQRRSGSYYIASNNSTSQKKKWLDEIERRLKIGMTVIANSKQRS